MEEQSRNLLTRGDLILRFYKHFVYHKLNISISLTDEIDYVQLRLLLNSLLRSEERITENESLAIHYREDTVLIFLFYLGIALDLLELDQTQIEHIVWSDSLLLPPISVYLKWKEDKAEVPPFYNMSQNDGLYTFKSGVKTRISKRLVSDINAAVKKLTKAKVILPPPIGGLTTSKQSKINNKSPLRMFKDKVVKRRSARIGDKTKISGATRYTNHGIYESELDSSGEESETPGETIFKATTKKNVTFQDSLQDTNASPPPYQHPTETEQTSRNTLYPDIPEETQETLNTSQNTQDITTTKTRNILDTNGTPNLAPFVENINSKLRGFVTPIWGFTTYTDLQEKTNPSRLELQDTRIIKGVHENVHLFRKNVLKRKYLMQNTLILDFLANCTCDILKSGVINVATFVDNIVYEYTAYKEGILTVEGQYDFPPILITEDRQFTEFIFRELSTSNREKMCELLTSIEDIFNKYYIVCQVRLNAKETISTERDRTLEEHPIQNTPKENNHSRTFDNTPRSPTYLQPGASSNADSLIDQIDTNQRNVIEEMINERINNITFIPSNTVRQVETQQRQEKGYRDKKGVAWINLTEKEDTEETNRSREKFTCSANTTNYGDREVDTLIKELKNKIKHNKNILKEMKNQDEDQGKQSTESRSEGNENDRLHIAQYLMDDIISTKEILNQINSDEETQGDDTETEWIKINLENRKGEKKVDNNTTEATHTDKSTIAENRTKIATPLGTATSKIGTNLILRKTDTSTQMSELNITDKLIKRMENKVEKFDGNRTKFLKFFSNITNKLDNKPYSESIKIEVAKHFITGVASDDIETHTFEKESWAEFKKYLVTRYIVDKKLAQIQLQKELDNITLKEGESVYSLYSRIQETVSLLTFLIPLKYTNKDEIIIQKLLSSIPSQYYYRITSPETQTLSNLLSELEKIQALTEALDSIQEANHSKFQDPAIRNMQVTENKDNQIRNNLTTVQNETKRKEYKSQEIETPYRSENRRGGEKDDLRREYNQVRTGGQGHDIWENQRGRSDPNRNQQYNNPQRYSRPVEEQKRIQDDRFNQFNSWKCNQCQTPNYNSRRFCIRCQSPGQDTQTSRTQHENNYPPINTCRIHKNAEHRAAECLISCGFCRRRGSHRSEDCLNKEKIKQDYIEKKIRQYGIGAERLARSLVSDKGIQPMTDESFSRMLKGQPIPPEGRNYEDYQQRNRTRE